MSFCANPLDYYPAIVNKLLKLTIIIPFHPGIRFQQVIPPCDINWPKPSSKMRRGIPATPRQMKYGIKKAPANRKLIKFNITSTKVAEKFLNWKPVVFLFVLFLFLVFVLVFCFKILSFVWFCLFVRVLLLFACCLLSCLLACLFVLGSDFPI